MKPSGRQRVGSPAEQRTAEEARDLTECNNDPQSGEPSEVSEINKPALVSHLSHELRTLLGGIIGINELLLASDLSAHQKQLAQTIDQSSKSLLSVINDIVDLSRIEIGSMSMESVPTDVCKIAVEVSELHSRKNNKQIKLNLAVCDSPVLVFTDPARVKQLISVLVLRMLNCIDKGTVELTVSMPRKSGTETELLIAASTNETMAGEAVYLSTLNNPRESGFNDSRWLSLFLVRKISQLMGGTCGSEQNGNSNRIWITLPARTLDGVGKD